MISLHQLFFYLFSRCIPYITAIMTFLLPVIFLEGWFITSKIVPHCGIVIDVGSTGTRVDCAYIKDGEPALKEIGDVRGGLAETSTSIVLDGLAKILNDASNELDILCGESDINRSLYVWGTGGMRLLPDEGKQKWDEVKEILQSYKKFDIKEIRTITGMEEGLYTLVADNLLNHRLSLNLIPQNDYLFATLEIGGASAQIALPRNNNIQYKYEDRKQITEADFFVQSHLGYGGDQILKELETKYDDFKGKCNFGSMVCFQFVKEKFNLLKKYCDIKPCFGNDKDMNEIKKIMPTISEMTLISQPYYNLKTIPWTLKDKSLKETVHQKLSYNQIYEWITTACKKTNVFKRYKDDSQDVILKKKMSNFILNEKYLKHHCFQLTYFTVILHDILPKNFKDKKIFKAVNKINDNKVTWTLGGFFLAENQML